FRRRAHAPRHALRGSPAPRPERRPSLVGASTVALSGFSELRTPITQGARAWKGGRGRGRWHEGARESTIVGVIGRSRAPPITKPVVTGGTVNEEMYYSGLCIR